jgi:heme-degrading monooxygenase HmoA
MYGTVARIRAKPAAEEKLIEFTKNEQDLWIPGLIGQYVYRMNVDPNEYYLVVIFEDKESYVANADSPEQDARYREFRSLLEEDPEWHDGEIVFGESRV